MRQAHDGRLCNSPSLSAPVGEILNLIKHQGTTGHTPGLQVYVESSRGDVARRNAARRVRFQNELATSRSYLCRWIKNKSDAHILLRVDKNLDRLLEQIGNVL